MSEDKREQAGRDEEETRRSEAHEEQEPALKKARKERKRDKKAKESKATSLKERRDCSPLALRDASGQGCAFTPRALGGLGLESASRRAMLYFLGRQARVILCRLLIGICHFPLNFLFIDVLEKSIPRKRRYLRSKGMQFGKLRHRLQRQSSTRRSGSTIGACVIKTGGTLRLDGALCFGFAVEEAHAFGS